MNETQERILDAAERLFALHGVGATSLRSITARAGVNSAAIHYHFGSKPALVRAIVERRIAPLERERLERLEALCAAAGDAPIAAARLLEAFLAPVAFAPAGLDEGLRSVGSLLAWLRGEDGDGPRPSGDVKRAYAEALCRGRELSQAEAIERLEYAMGATIHMLLQAAPSPASSDRELRALASRLGRLLRFLAAGCETPAMLPADGSPRTSAHSLAGRVSCPSRGGSRAPGVALSGRRSSS